jgi:MOSC domain-containing protein YiiM
VKILSVSVGRPREVAWRGAVVRTAIFKEPVSGPVTVRALNLDGDGQADLSVHGGPGRAVYAYPSEHYAYWRAVLPGRALPHGVFGENLTTEGLTEETVYIGDRFRIGSAEAVVTQPRLPCYKLGLRFGRKDVVTRFLSSGRTGFYLAVAREGEVAPGDAIELVGRDPHGVSVADIVRLRRGDGAGDELLALLRRAVLVPALPEGVRRRFRKQIEDLSR